MKPRFLAGHHVTLTFTSIHIPCEVALMTVWGKGHRAKLAAACGFCIAGLLASSPACARAEHHHRLYHAAYRYHHDTPAPYVPPSAGFGPTAPGASTILIDAASGQVISQNGADIPRYPASLTKLMTLDLAFQALRDGRMSLDTQIPVSYHASAVEPVKLGLAPGSTITVRQAILAMTTMSANDAATALGEYLGGGSEDRCAQMMTLRAHSLGMAQTQFYNASGLPNPNQITTARDLAILARDIVVSFPEDQQFFEVTEFDFNGHSVFSNNGMLKSYPGATGMKTGYTILARHNLVTSAVRDGRVLIGVTLHEPSWGMSYQEMTAMLDDGFGGHLAGPNPNSMVLTAANMAAPAPQYTPPAMSAPPAAPVQSVASNQPLPTPALPAASRLRPVYAGSWTAQLGLYSRMSKARIVAIRVEQMRGIGIARIARVERHGKTLWTAQLAGLSFSAAHDTCSVLAARGDSCRIIAPSTDHLAMEVQSDGSGT
jgi:D-alanyl-D-alanine carboxypeptidase